ncbi:hypothetical protein [Yoonia sp. 2307UL14-13]|uniref:hypothetical protein n=1 Tax=Yoonia sp. 2307UL14-13 TaxID=3126506 RepID=UPI0030A4939E
MKINLHRSRDALLGGSENQVGNDALITVCKALWGKSWKYRENFRGIGLSLDDFSGLLPKSKLKQTAPGDGALTKFDHTKKPSKQDWGDIHVCGLCDYAIAAWRTGELHAADDE